MTRFLVLFLTVSLLAVTGCATITQGRTQTVSINSNVSDAQITANGVVVGRTPFTGLIARSNSTVVTVSKEGYVSKTITLDTSVETIFWGNIIIGGVVGSTTDLATGSMYKYAPATLQIDLEKKPS